MTTTAAPGVTVRRVPELDGLRGIAIALVLVYHLWPGVLPGGNIGVDLFFVLSGFLVTSWFTGRFAATGRPSITAFWVRRGRRLVPALLCVLLVGTALALPTGEPLPARLGPQLLAALTWTGNWYLVAGDTGYFASFDPLWWQHLWSLGIEAQFYLVWPLILLGLWRVTAGRPIGARLRACSVAAAVLAAASAAGLVVGTVAGADFSRLYLGTGTHLFGLLAGAAVALWPRRPGAGTSPGRPGAGYPAAAVLLTGLVVVAVSARDDDPLAQAAGLPVAALLGAAVIATVIRSPAGTAPGILRCGALRRLGIRSYGVYLWHWPLLLTARRLVPEPGPVPAALLGLGVLVLTLAAAELSWRHVENPVLRDGWTGAFRAARTAGRDLLSRPLPLFAVLTGTILLAGAAVAAVLLSPGLSPLEHRLGR
ncbi:acyltransferase family protein [Pseudonocardia sp. HH130630-07]|uniref:acyltransferase family protein n=1 Tax=Pseudonocardia sp. HH130630-07 TaxID=1690815 RepID=UPI000814F709|nr:acyltransferase [Pseudonocardia sp. HH130630-07]ANY08128.1 hypothetical protein AFB00_19605 [Pseudonocardia sp. HH130630-07]